MISNFLLGKLKITEAAALKLKRTPLDLVARHAVNEHGCATPAELRRNTRSMKTVGKILSRYMVDPTDKSQGFVLVITDEEWSETTVKLEGET